jgi:single-strand DNA-binding protein
MPDLNEVRLIGRLTRDPESKMTTVGKEICTFGLAIGHSHRDATGTTKNEVTFVDVTCWGRLAEIVSKYMRKGSLVFVGGRLKLDSWQDRETGGKRNKLSVVAENVQFLGAKSREQESAPWHAEPEKSFAPSNQVTNQVTFPDFSDEPPF